MMLGRDSVPRLRVFTSRYICPNCLSRSYTTHSPPVTYHVSSFRSKNRQIGVSGLQERHVVAHRYFTTARSHQATGAAVAASTPPLEHSFLSPSGLGFENPEDVRAYLKKWGQENQKSIIQNAPDKVQIQRNVALPNSLFLRNSTDAAGDADNGLEVEVEAADFGELPSPMDDVDDASVAAREELIPGHVLRINSRSGLVRSQLAICLGNRGVQTLWLLADGRWYASCREVYSSHVIHGFATPAELSSIAAYLPLKTIEYEKADDGGTVPYAAVGEIPHIHSRHLLQKLAKLNEETDEAKRNHPAVIDQLYDKVADESEFVHAAFDDLLRDHLNIHMDKVTNGVRMHMYGLVHRDERVNAENEKGRIMVGFLPKRMNRSVGKVIEWARAYQDAAARAAIGKNVSEALRNNPLIPFIGKARRLISQSRKIRLPTLECQLGPTLEAMRPASGVVERRRNAEEFTEDEKKILEFLWVTYVKRPESHNAGGRRSRAVASLIIRAVGAYPKFTLNSNTGILFLKELGCLDPWAMPSDYLLPVPRTGTGLHQAARLAKETSEAATAALGMEPGQEASPLPDTMAHLRKDWGDLEVFCIDKMSTRVVDDGISIEPSQEFPDHYWVRAHIAHISAFVPYDSPLLAQATSMGSTQYSHSGSEPYIPFDAVRPYSLGANKPVLTFSTLLSPEGTIKDVQVTPGIIRNVIKLDMSLVNEWYRINHVNNTLSVGPVKPEEPSVLEAEHKEEQERREMTERYRPTLDLLQRLGLLRWEARFRDSPEHLKMLKLPAHSSTLDIQPKGILQNPSYERIFRSEHVVGDLSVSLNCDVTDHGNKTNYRGQTIKYQPVAAAMILACEAAALWASARTVPIIYRYNTDVTKTPMSQLNSLGPHDFYVGLITGESLDMRKHLALCIEGYAHVTSPLRRYRDLINHYQIDAYLLAQAGKSEQLDGASKEIKYPRSRQQLSEIFKVQTDGHTFARWVRLQTMQWSIYTLYRAFYFQEGRLPKVWDVFVNNPVAVGATSSETDTTCRGTIFALGSLVTFDATEQGWEKVAKFRQYLPCKLTMVSPATGIRCVAIGPPTDEPSVKDLAVPELQGG